MGAGRPAGVTKEGRALRAVARAALADLVGTSRDPLLIAIDIAADEKQPAPLRLEAALGAARFVHPALSASAVQVAHKPSNAGAVVQVLLDRLAALAPSGSPIIDVVKEPHEVPV